MSRLPTSVNYNGEKSSTRNHFTWILFKDYENITVTLNSARNTNNDQEKGFEKDIETAECANELIFRVEWPERSIPSQSGYKLHRDTYLKEYRDAPPSLSQLDVESQQSTAVATKQYTPIQHPIYKEGEEIGRGSFGVVYKVVNVSTGATYAAKSFHSGKWRQEVEVLRSLSHVSSSHDRPFDWLLARIYSWLTACKGTYHRICRFHRGASTSTSEGISSTWEFGFSRFRD